MYYFFTMHKTTMAQCTGSNGCLGAPMGHGSCGVQGACGVSARPDYCFYNCSGEEVCACGCRCRPRLVSARREKKKRRFLLRLQKERTLEDFIQVYAQAWVLVGTCCYRSQSS